MVTSTNYNRTDLKHGETVNNTQGIDNWDITQWEDRGHRETKMMSCKNNRQFVESTLILFIVQYKYSNIPDA